MTNFGIMMGCLTVMALGAFAAAVVLEPAPQAHVDPGPDITIQTRTQIEPKHEGWCRTMCVNHGGALYVHVTSPYDKIECVCDEFRNFTFGLEVTPLLEIER